MTPFADVESISLADYLAEHDDQLGPVTPAFISAAGGDTLADSQSTQIPSQLRLAGVSEGEDDPPPEDPPPSDPPPEDPPPEDPPPDDPPPGDPAGGDPTIGDTEVINNNGTLTISGMLSDDGGVGNLNISVDNGTPNIFVSEDGSFTVNIMNTEGYNTFTITVTDADGNITTFTVDYSS